MPRKRSLLGAERVVHLDEPRDEPTGGKFLFAEGPREEATFVTALFQIDQKRTRSGCWGKNHDVLVSAEPMELILERAEADKLISVAILLAEAVLDHLAVQLFHPAASGCTGA